MKIVQLLEESLQPSEPYGNHKKKVSQRIIGGLKVLDVLIE